MAVAVPSEVAKSTVIGSALGPDKLTMKTLGVPAPSETIPSSWRIALCRSTFVAPSERPSARAISRLSMPSAKRMISASRRSSGSF